MLEKMAVFRSSLAGELIDEEVGNSGVNEAWIEKKDKQLKKPYNSEELEDFFDAFLTRQLPEDEVYMIAFVNGKLYKSSPRARPEILKQALSLLQ